MSELDLLIKQIESFGWRPYGKTIDGCGNTFFFVNGRDKLDLYEFPTEEEKPYTVEMEIGDKSINSEFMSYKECQEYLEKVVAEYPPSSATTQVDASMSAALMACLSGLHWRIKVLEDSTVLNK